MNHQLLIMQQPLLKNDLKVDHVEYFKDPANSRLIVIVESQKGFSDISYVKVDGTKIVIDSVRNVDLYLKPIKTHHIQRDDKNELYSESLKTGRSEVALMKSYTFEVVSYQVISQDLLRIILHYEKKQNEIIYN